MKVVINPGHCPGLDSGCVGSKINECDLAKTYGEKVKAYLEAAGLEVILVQDNDLQTICDTANNAGADAFAAIHFNAAENADAAGTETFYAEGSKNGKLLAEAIQKQLVDTLGTTDRGTKTDELYVTKDTNMPAILVEVGFLSNEAEQDMCINRADDAAAAIARGITDYQTLVDHDTHINENQPEAPTGDMMSKYFSRDELECHCGCGGCEVDPILLQFLDDLRERIGKPIFLSCSYRCPEHNQNCGGVPNSQHTISTAADVLVPDGMTVDELADIAVELGADGVGRYYNSSFVHMDVRASRSNAGYAWDDQG